MTHFFLHTGHSVLGKEEERQMFHQMQALAQKQVVNTFIARHIPINVITVTCNPQFCYVHFKVFCQCTIFAICSLCNTFYFASHLNKQYFAKCMNIVMACSLEDKVLHQNNNSPKFMETLTSYLYPIKICIFKITYFISAQSSKYKKSIHIYKSTL